MSDDRPPSDLLAWLDLETTGLKPVENHHILEIAVVVTDGHLRMVNVGPSVVVRVSKAVLVMMETPVQEMHTKNGLWEECLESGKTLREAESTVLEWLEHFEEAGRVPLAGSTISFDRAFLAYWMPQLHDWFHYRNVDVSTYKETFKRWLPQTVSRMPEKKEAHRAQADILESIDALRFFHNEIMEAHSRIRVPF